MPEPIQPRGEVIPLEQLTSLNDRGEVIIRRKDLQRAIAQSDPELRKFIDARLR